MIRKIIYILLISGSILACSEDELTQITPPPPACDSEAAFATCLTPQFPPEYYIEQGVKYFLTMQSDIPPSVQPNYSDRVVRWEWPPWLLLTGYTRRGLVVTDILLKLNPTSYDLIDCRFFEEQPFCRCHVIFNYSGELCPIYEEFIFNDQGEITFIEAWSDYESLLPMTSGPDGIWTEDEYWGATIGDNRLGNRVPGLGNSEGRIDLYADWMTERMQYDADLEDMVLRARDPILTWLDELLTSETLATGCEAPEGDVYPYYVP